MTYFHPLSEEHVRQIAGLELGAMLGRQGIADRKIAVDVTPSVLDLIVKDGYDEHYGARALRRMVQRHVTVPIATLLLEREVADGSILRVVAVNHEVRVEVVETAESRARKAESRPLVTPFGRLNTNSEIKSVLHQLKRSRTALVGQLASRGSTGNEADGAADGRGPWHPEALARAARRRELDLAADRRLTRLSQDELDFERWLERTATREERQRVVDALARHERELRTAWRELVQMPPTGSSDALLELVALGPNNERAIDLFRVYAGWAKRRGYSLEMVCEPLLAAEPIIAAVGGHYAYGYLHLETGHHRFRGAQHNSVVRVRVLPWVDRSEPPVLAGQVALKKTGLLGGRVRSRVLLEGSALVLQNERTLVENGAFAASIAPSYQPNVDAVETEVRRYDDQPFLLKDHLTGTTGRADALSPDRLHELLCERIGVTYPLPAD